MLTQAEIRGPGAQGEEAVVTAILSLQERVAALETALMFARTLRGEQLWRIGREHSGGCVSLRSWRWSPLYMSPPNYFDGVPML